MTDTLSKIEKRTAYTLLLPAVFLVFAIVLFPIFANIWISFKEVQLKDIRIPEPRAKKIVKTISEDNTKLKIIYRLRNSSLIENIDNIKFLDKLPTNIEPIDLDSRCTFRSKKFNVILVIGRQNIERILRLWFKMLIKLRLIKILLNLKNLNYPVMLTIFC